ncbi:DUF2845 domain-containing protein [Corallincola spongiicola]|uniref:DUF2845 domain-containing protein n=1 Tax=Corallincola spongiicola TaxID=2520508 RepID=A0ABY1WTZ4_9GAMM|nr:DUF2845 domain-containing protein [Corallincola spongiicola]TAA48098.1 hypothetical protein EXY25_02330 [Corallincola spongiicola]
MRSFYQVSLLFISIVSSAIVVAGTYTVTNVKCEGGWVTREDDKLVVISKCGSPVLSDVVSGDDETKVERVGFQLENEKQITIFTFKAGKVVLIEKISD